MSADFLRLPGLQVESGGLSFEVRQDLGGVDGAELSADGVADFEDGALAVREGARFLRVEAGQGRRRSAGGAASTTTAASSAESAGRGRAGLRDGNRTRRFVIARRGLPVGISAGDLARVV